MAGAQESEDHRPSNGRVVIERGDRRAELRWHHNRFHYHPRILRLTFSGFNDLNAEALKPAVAEALRKLLARTEDLDPLLFRTTIPSEPPLLTVLLELGLLETRRVYRPLLHLDDPRVADSLIAGQPWQPVGSGGAQLETAASAEVRDEPGLRELLTEVYVRTSRLDPATPERLHPGELWAALTDGLTPNISTCAYLGGELVGVCTLYDGEAPDGLELGVLGVRSAQLHAHGGRHDAASCNRVPPPWRPRTPGRNW